MPSFPFAARLCPFLMNQKAAAMLPGLSGMLLERRCCVHPGHFQPVNAAASQQWHVCASGEPVRQGE